MTQCNSQLAFPFFKRADLVATSDAGDIVTDKDRKLAGKIDALAARNPIMEVP